LDGDSNFQEVEEAIKKLKSGKGAGLDGIVAEIKYNSDILVQPLCKFI